MDKVSCIYRISHKLDFENNNVYIGSTSNLNTRKRLHKSSCINENDRSYHLKLYEYIRKNDGLDNFEFTILRVCNDTDKKERLKLEQSFIDVYQPTLNTNSASQTPDEYYEKNKEEILKKQKGYREEHKEEISKRRGEVIECECGKNITRSNISTHRKTKHHQEYLKFNEEK